MDRERCHLPYIQVWFDAFVRIQLINLLFPPTLLVGLGLTSTVLSGIDRVSIANGAFSLSFFSPFFDLLWLEAVQTFIVGDSCLSILVKLSCSSASLVVPSSTLFRVRRLCSSTQQSSTMETRCTNSCRPSH